MPQLSLYLDEPALERLRNDAASTNKSLSAYTRELIMSGPNLWPMGYWDLYGALADESFELPGELDESLDRPLPAFD